MDSIGVHQAGRLQIEALGFEETKGRFDGPPLAIQRYDLVQIGAIGYQEDAFAFGRSVTDQMQRQVLIQADVFIDLGRVTPLMAATQVQIETVALGRLDPVIRPNTQYEGHLLPLEKLDPLLADKFAIGQQAAAFDREVFEGGSEQFLTFLGMRITGFFQAHGDHGHRDAFV